MIIKKFVLVFAGLPLSGKTTVGALVAERLGIGFIDIDAAPAQCAPPQAADSFSTEEARAAEKKRMMIAYHALHGAVEGYLKAGLPVAISATYSSQISQETIRGIVERAGGEIQFIVCTFDDTADEVARRIRQRVDRGEAGGVRDAAHYEEIKSRFHPITELVHEVDSSASAEKQAEDIASYIRQLWMMP